MIMMMLTFYDDIDNDIDGDDDENGAKEEIQRLLCLFQQVDCFTCIIIIVVIIIITIIIVTSSWSSFAGSNCLSNPPLWKNSQRFSWRFVSKISSKRERNSKNPLLLFRRAWLVLFDLNRHHHSHNHYKHHDQ